VKTGNLQEKCARSGGAMPDRVSKWPSVQCDVPDFPTLLNRGFRKHSGICVLADEAEQGKLTAAEMFVRACLRRGWPATGSAEPAPDPVVLTARTDI
jgi:hypothetical protein